MTPTSLLKPLVFRDNSEWLRYVLLAGSMTMCVLVFNSFTEAERDIDPSIPARPKSKSCAKRSGFSNFCELTSPTILQKG